MRLFRYKAVDPMGEVVEGEIEATDRADVAGRLYEQGHTPLHVEEVGIQRSVLRGLRLRRERIDLGRFTRDLSILLKTGSPLERALEMLVELAEDPVSVSVVNRLLDDVRSGATFSAALEAQKGVFNDFYINMVRASESAGALEEVLVRLAQFIEEYGALKRSVKTALIYPGVLVFLTAISLFILISFVVPQFTVLFSEVDQQLPLLSQVVIGVSTGLQEYAWLVLSVLLLAGVYLRQRLRQPEFRYRWHRRLLRLPIIGDLIIKVEVSIFARTLGTLLASGVPLLSALTIVSDTMGNRALSQAIETVAESVKEGRGLAGPIAASGSFPRLASHLVRVGEESGELETTLFQLADIYDLEVKTAIQRALALLEPALIIGLGVIIGLVVSAILLAILSINELVF